MTFLQLPWADTTVSVYPWRASLQNFVMHCCGFVLVILLFILVFKLRQMEESLGMIDLCLSQKSFTCSTEITFRWIIDHEQERKNWIWWCKDWNLYFSYATFDFELNCPPETATTAWNVCVQKQSALIASNIGILERLVKWNKLCLRNCHWKEMSQVFVKSVPSLS